MHLPTPTFPSININRLYDVISSGKDADCSPQEMLHAVQGYTLAGIREYRELGMELQLARIVEREHELAEEGRRENRIMFWNDDEGGACEIVIDRGYNQPSYAKTHQEWVDNWKAKEAKADTARTMLVDALDLFISEPTGQTMDRYLHALGAFVEATDSEIICAAYLYAHEPQLYAEMEEDGEDPTQIAWISLE